MYNNHIMYRYVPICGYWKQTTEVKYDVHVKNMNTLAYVLRVIQCKLSNNVFLKFLNTN